MARLKSEELQEAKRQKKEREQLEREKEIQQVNRIEQLKVEHAQLESFVDGIYEELSKLNVKWPTHPVSKIALEQTNRAISQLKEMVSNEEDLFVQDIHELIPAGDMPEQRDVVLTLRQVKQALDRLALKHRLDWKEF
jgi:predicted nuclease with TOPRIM domain